MTFTDNKYSKWYFQIVETAKQQVLTQHFERHHIVPKSLGGSNTSCNVVRLSYKQHFICHLLLTKMTEGNAKRKMNHSLRFMITKSKNHLSRTDLEVNKIFSRWFVYCKKQRAIVGVSAETRKKMSVAMLGKNIGRKHSVETRKKMSEAAKNRATCSEETKQKISERLVKEWALGIRAKSALKTADTRRANGWKGSMYGKNHSEETRKKMSESAKISRSK